MSVCLPRAFHDVLAHKIGFTTPESVQNPIDVILASEVPPDPFRAVWKRYGPGSMGEDIFAFRLWVRGRGYE
jgi:hypothetical protein